MFRVPRGFGFQFSDFVFRVVFRFSFFVFPIPGFGFKVEGLGLDLAMLACAGHQHSPRKVYIRLPGTGNSNSHGTRPVHQIISMIKWIRTSRLSIKNSLSWDWTCAGNQHSVGRMVPRTCRSFRRGPFSKSWRPGRVYRVKDSIFQKGFQVRIVVF